MPSRLIAPAPAASQGHLPSQAKMPGHITVTLESSMAPASIPVATISGQQVGPTHLGLSSSAKFLYSLSWKWRWWRTALFSLSCRDKVTCTTWWQPTCRLSGAAHLHCRSALLPLPLTLSHPTCPEVSSNIVAAQMHCCTSVWTCIKYDTLGGECFINLSKAAYFAGSWKCCGNCNRKSGFSGAAAAAVMSSSKGPTVLRPACGANAAAGQPAAVQHIIHQSIPVHFLRQYPAQCCIYTFTFDC